MTSHLIRVQEVVVKTNMDVVHKALTEEDIRNKITLKTLIKDNNQINPNLSWAELECNNNQTYSKI